MSLGHETLFSEKQAVYFNFARFVGSFIEAKNFLRNGHILDSFNSTLLSLQHWARLAIHEVGELPAATVWEQIKHIDSSIYKLYEELITSMEPLEKRIELLLLALDFTVLSKLEKCVQFLLDILKSKQTPWALSEIMNHPMMADTAQDVSVILDKMVKRALIKEHLIDREGIQEKGYSTF